MSVENSGRIRWGLAICPLLVVVGLVLSWPRREAAVGTERAVREEVVSRRAFGSAPTARREGLEMSSPGSGSAIVRKDEVPMVAEAATEGDATASVEAKRAVSGFCAETDRWTRERPVTVEDIQEFVRTFNAIPPPLRKGSVHRALNLVPDANVALLAGLLLDKSQPTEVTREVFNDIVNRPEEVKKPILDEIYKDKTHPCCSDVEWIFEVTGEKPE